MHDGNGKPHNHCHITWGGARICVASYCAHGRECVYRGLGDGFKPKVEGDWCVECDPSLEASLPRNPNQDKALGGCPVNGACPNRAQATGGRRA